MPPAGVLLVRRRDDGAVVVTLDALESLPFARPYVDAAFVLARGASRLILDLRGNGGGDPATVAEIAGRLLGRSAQHLSDVVYADRRRQWWTADRPEEEVVDAMTGTNWEGTGVVPDVTCPQADAPAHA